MPITYEKAMYFWHRYLEGADPETRTLRKWNGAYPDDQTTLAEIVGFVDSMKSIKARLSTGDSVAMQILCGDLKESDLMPAPAKKSTKRGR